MKQYVNEAILAVMCLFFGYFAMHGNSGANYFAVASFSSLLILINPKGTEEAPRFPDSPPNDQPKQ